MSGSEQASTLAEDLSIKNETEAPHQTDNSNANAGSRDLDAEKAQSQPPGSDAPDGGSAAWIVVFGAWCTSFCSFGWLNSSVGVFQEYYEDDLLSGYSAGTISWIPSLQIFFMMGMGPFVGAIYDRYGPRLLLFFGSILHIFGVMMASLGSEYYQILLAQGVCSAIGASAIFQPSINCTAGWFNRKRGVALGLVFTGSSIGGIILPIALTHLIKEVGFGWSMRICAFIMLFLLMIANLTIRPWRPSPQTQKVTWAQLAKPFSEVQFILTAIGFFFFSYGFFAAVNYLPVEAVSAGMSSNLVQYLLPILNAGSLFGRLFSGFLGDKLGRYNIFIFVCYLSGLWILALWLPDTTNAALIAFSALFGFFSGAYVSLIIPLLIQISPMSEIGFRTGMVTFLISLGGLTTNPVNGAIIDSSGGWAGLKIFSGVLCLAGTSFVLVARIKQTGWKLLARF
ncbi:Monocarboxylate transporter 4 [Talaromyces islandicus]|uniref:Monocarboxylate transporter 4 n=1 Tax=Talaromyces islandicus TaxID=28573 RepID=A0A0U1LUU4_TALIS|nr:Monocarboxylate transporter 4 [Talaromyces islandicus]